MERVDIVIVGAGLSGIGVACHLTRECPSKSYVLLEAREALGGTWDLFRYPGVRSDSDMFTLGYSFRPWREAKAIADGEHILRYIEETAREYDVLPKIRYRTRVLRAAWSTAEARWIVDVERDGTTSQLSCAFLLGCSGYYRYDAGYEPTFAGTERYAGRIVHPQKWPQDLDWRDKRVVVIGSGATAVTLVPSLAKDAQHVTMLQRSPSYIMSLPAHDRIADSLRAKLPARVAYPLVRWKNVLLGTLSYQVSRRWPTWMKGFLRKRVVRAMPEGFDVDTHFAPRYDPWDQRLCLVPDGDLFKTVRKGRASIVTDHIARFDERGIVLESGTRLDADIVVMATGLNLLAFGGIEFSVDGLAIELAKTVSYKGMMLCGVPNFAFALGYTNASWTLKVDLVAKYVCRLLQRMDKSGARVCVPDPPDASLPTEPFLGLSSGYVQRSLAKLPKQGSRAPWRLHQNYVRDYALLKWGRIDDGALRFS